MIGVNDMLCKFLDIGIPFCGRHFYECLFLPIRRYALCCIHMEFYKSFIYLFCISDLDLSVTNIDFNLFLAENTVRIHFSRDFTDLFNKTCNIR
jgi:hypothetical protein